MAEKKTCVRFFTIADYLDEEKWLREKHKAGWRFVKCTVPCFYRFEPCEPEDVIYRLDYKNARENPDYMQMTADFGWEYCGECNGWLYFRKPAEQAESEGDTEIFSDNESRLEMVQRVIKTRLLPLLVIFLCIIIPNLFLAPGYGIAGLRTFLTVGFVLLFVLYAYLLVHCGRKFRKIKQTLK